MVLVIQLSFKEHAHNRLCSKMAKDTKFARVLKTTLPPTKTMQACDTHTSTLCSSLKLPVPKTHLFCRKERWAGRHVSSRWQ